MNVKAIIFDWVNTLYDTESRKEYSDSEEILKFCQEKGIRMVVASLATTNESTERIAQIESSHLRKYFEKVFVIDRDKDKILAQATEYLNLPKEELLIVDDHAKRGVDFGIRNGYLTAWLQSGPFAGLLPNGKPTLTIKSLLELKNIF